VTAEMWDVGYEIWDMGYGIWDMGYGIWDMGNVPSLIETPHISYLISPDPHTFVVKIIFASFSPS